MKNLKDILILIMGLIILIFILLKGCAKPNIDKNIKPSIVTVEKHDTIRPPADTIYAFKIKYYPKWDSVKTIDTVFDANLCNFERSYSDSLDDSNITIYSNQKILGLIKESKTSYKLKVPLIINNSKETTITNVETKEPSFSLNTGLELAGNKASFNLSPFIGVTIRRSTIKVGYGLLDNTIQIGVGYRLLKSKK